MQSNILEMISKLNESGGNASGTNINMKMKELQCSMLELGTQIMELGKIVKAMEGASQTQVFVKTLTGETITVNVKCSDTVEFFKACILDKRTRLAFAGKELASGILSDHGIQRLSTVFEAPIVLAGGKRARATAAPADMVARVADSKSIQTCLAYKQQSIRNFFKSLDDVRQVKALKIINTYKQNPPRVVNHLAGLLAEVEAVEVACANGRTRGVEIPVRGAHGSP